MSQIATASTASPKSAIATRRIVDFTLPLLIAAIGLPLIGVTYLTLTGSMPALGPLTGTQAFLLRVVSAIPSVLMTCAMFALRKVLVERPQNSSRLAISPWPPCW